MTRTIPWTALLLAVSSTASADPRALSLEEAVDLALKSDPTVAQARIAEDRSKNAVLRSQLDRISLRIDGQLQELWTKANIGGPTIYNCTVGTLVSVLDPATCAEFGGISTRAPDQQPENGQGLFNLSANLNVPIFSGLRVESNVSMRQRLRDSSTADIRRSRKDVALAVARTYWRVRGLALSRDVEAATLERLREAELVTEARVRAGLSPPIDKNRSVLQRLQQTVTLADLDGTLRQSAAQLAVALGVTDELNLVDQPSIPSVPPPVQELLDDAHKGRPELAVARLRADAQRFAVRMAKSGYYPQLNAFGLFQLGNNALLVGSGVRTTSDALNPFANISGTLTIGASLSMNFFDMLNTWTSVRDAGYEEARLREETRRTQRIVDADVQVQHANVLRLIAVREPVQQARDVARENMTILQTRYQNGDALFIEYLQGQNELARAERQLVDVTVQLHLAFLELEAALGQVVGVRP